MQWSDSSYILRMTCFPNKTMAKQKVLLVCSNYIFGEGLQTLLQKEEDLEIIGPWELEVELISQLEDLNLDVVVVVDEDPNSEEAIKLTSKILQQLPDHPIIRVGLTQNVFYIVETHAFPARGKNLVETIRELPDAQQWQRMKDEENKE